MIGADRRAWICAFPKQKDAGNRYTNRKMMLFAILVVQCAAIRRNPAQCSAT